MALPFSSREEPGLSGLIVQYKWSVIGIAILVCGSAIFFSLQATPTYASEAKVLVKPIPKPLDDEESNAPNLITEQEVAASASTAGRVIDELDLSETPRELLKDLTVNPVPEAEILIITYEHGTPRIAAERAQAFAEAYLDFRRELAVREISASLSTLDEEIEVLTDRITELNRRIAATGSSSREAALESRVSFLSGLLVQRELARLPLENEPRIGEVVDDANVPSTPVSPNHRLNAILGLVLGLVLGTGQAMLRGRLSGRITSAEELEALLDAPTLGAIRRVRAWGRKRSRPLITDRRTPPDLIEAFRFVRSSVLSVAAPRGASVLLVTSADVGEGKTVMAANLAIALATGGKRVLLVSGDLRKPQMDELFVVHEHVGLTDVLSESASVSKAAVATMVPRLHLMPSGKRVGNPAELLASDGTNRLLQGLRENFDFVIFDTPPLSGVADAVTLTPLTDGVILIADAGRSNVAAVATARRQLERVGGRILGGLLNRAALSEVEARSYYIARGTSRERVATEDHRRVKEVPG